MHDLFRRLRSYIADEDGRLRLLVLTALLLAFALVLTLVI